MHLLYHASSNEYHEILNSRTHIIITYQFSIITIGQSIRIQRRVNNEIKMNKIGTNFSYQICL